MNIEEDIVAWAKNRPNWQQDVLRKLCQQESFDETAIAAIANQLVSGSSFQVPGLAVGDIPGTSISCGGVRLGALENLTGVNALAPGQTLTFGPTGITIIYGDNASGKSGYARLLKSALGARVREDILGDVFAKNAQEPHALVHYSVGSDITSREWRCPGPASAELQQVHFNDEACGDAYLSADSEITYRPSSLILLDQLIAVCDAVRVVLDQLLSDNDASKPSLPTVAAYTMAGRFLAGLQATTSAAEIDAGCQEPTDAKETLGGLLSEEARLKASDPTKERDRLTELANNLDIVRGFCVPLAEALSVEGIEELGEVRTSASELRAAAVVASSQNFDAEPVPGVGGATWRALWDAARAYSESDAYHNHTFPVTEAASRCVLCQQELSPDAAGRLQRFQTFMADTTERDAAKAEQTLVLSRQRIAGLSQSSPAVVAALAKLRVADADIADQLDEWVQAATKACVSITSWLDGWENAPIPIGPSPAKALADRALQSREQAAAIDATSFAETVRSVACRSTELQATMALAAHKPAVGEEVARLKARVQIEAAKKTTDTGPITRKSSELTRSYVTRQVRDQFTRESERLRLRRITLDDTGGVKGQLRHRPALLGAATPAAVKRVLSEGEQTALGLSGFFTEVTFDETKSALVLDDPVTSLDHERRYLVAQRLAQLATDRQVVVFTHEITFVGDLVKHAAEAHVVVTERWIQRNGDVLGVCVDKHPWKAKDVGARINELDASIAEIKRDRVHLDQEAYEECCASWAGRLSETWERAINLEIVNEVVDRGTSQVRPQKFRILASISQTDNDEFQAGYGRCSEWARRHDKAPEVNFVAPSPDDMQAELERLRVWFKRIKGYRA